MNFLTRDMTIPRRKLLAVTSLFSSSFAWFFVFYRYSDELLAPGLLPYTFWHILGLILLLLSIAISALIGSVAAGKINRRKFVFLWLVTGILASVPILFFHGKEYLVIWGTVAGLSFGFGFPSCQAYLAESTIPEERGRVAGLGILVTFILVIFAFLLKAVFILEATSLLLLLIGIRSLGFLSFLLDPIERVENEAKPWRVVLGSRDFNFYLLAFILFLIAAGLVSLLWQAVPSTEEYEAASESGQVLRLLVLCVSAIIAGVAADRVGRKKPIVFGTIMLGVAYAIVGLFTTADTFFATLILSGLAWGIIMVLYLVIPGDLAFPGSTERFYTVGWVLPLMLYIGVEGSGSLIGVYPIDIFSTILSIILFVSVLPVLFAVETLSESKIRERKIREHTEKVGKIIKETKKEE